VGKIRNYKLTWKPSESDLDIDNFNVNYRLYWSNLPPVTYNSNFVMLGNVTEVDLPDTLGTHESSGGLIYIGISAVDQWGNESDIITLPEPFKLTAPAAPVDLKLNTLNYFKITAPRGKAENQDTDRRKRPAEKTDQEIQPNVRRPVGKFIPTEGKIIDAFCKTFEY